MMRKYFYYIKRLLIIINIILVVVFLSIYIINRKIINHWRFVIDAPTFANLTSSMPSNYYVHIKVNGSDWIEDIYRMDKNIKVLSFDQDTNMFYEEYYDLLNMRYYWKTMNDKRYKEGQFTLDKFNPVLFETLWDGYRLDVKPIENKYINGNYAYLYELLPDEEHLYYKPKRIWVWIDYGLPLNINNGEYIYDYKDINRINFSDVSLSENSDIYSLNEQHQDAVINKLTIYIKKGYDENRLKTLFPEESSENLEKYIKIAKENIKIQNQ